MPATESLSFELPVVSRWQLRLFALYVRFYLARHFHGLHLLETAPLNSLAGMPVLICLNHPSWWDPLIAVYLSQRFFADRRQYSPIASKGLEKYRFFERLGFFGIDPESRSGAQRFLQIGRAVLKRPDGVLWVTAQGHFKDVRERPVTLSGGVGHLAHGSATPFVLLPIALEYSFWEERTPEALVCLGEPEVIRDGRSATAAHWTKHFAGRLEETQDHLARQVLSRDPSAFQPLLKGHAGVGGIYDVWRAAKSLGRGKRFRAEHGGRL